MKTQRARQVASPLTGPFYRSKRPQAAMQKKLKQCERLLCDLATEMQMIGNISSWADLD